MPTTGTRGEGEGHLVLHPMDLKVIFISKSLEDTNQLEPLPMVEVRDYME